MYRESLLNNREQIELSKKLATIHCDVPISFSIEEVKAQTPDINALKPLYREMEFFSLLKELGPTEDSHDSRLSRRRVGRSAGRVVRGAAGGCASRPRFQSGDDERRR